MLPVVVKPVIKPMAMLVIELKVVVIEEVVII
jgi:hypothetical protein